MWKIILGANVYTNTYPYDLLAYKMETDLGPGDIIGHYDLDSKF